MSVWLAIDDVDEANGAMQFVPGSHRLGALDHVVKPLDGTRVLKRQVEHADSYVDRVSDSLRAGEMSLHSDLLLHGSHPNASDRRRAGDHVPLRGGSGALRSGREWWGIPALHCRGLDPGALAELRSTRRRAARRVRRRLGRLRREPGSRRRLNESASSGYRQLTLAGHGGVMARHRPVFVALALLAIAGAACSSGSQPDAGPTTTSTPDVPGSAASAVDVLPAVPPKSKTIAGTMQTPDGRVRTFHVYIPSTITPGRSQPPVPLLVALHGGLGSGRQFERTSGFDGLAEANRFIVVYPDGVGVGPDEQNRTWNSGECCGSRGGRTSTTSRSSA